MVRGGSKCWKYMHTFTDTHAPEPHSVSLLMLCGPSLGWGRGKSWGLQSGRRKETMGPQSLTGTQRPPLSHLPGSHLQPPPTSPASPVRCPPRGSTARCVNTAGALTKRPCGVHFRGPRARGPALLTQKSQAPNSHSTTAFWPVDRFSHLTASQLPFTVNTLNPILTAKETDTSTG